MTQGWGKRLETARLRAGRDNKTTFPAMVGSNNTSWQGFENEKVFPRLDILARVKELTGVNLNWLATGEGAPFEDGTLSASVDVEVLSGCIQAIDEVNSSLDAQTRAKLAAVLYNDRIKVIQQEREERAPKMDQSA